MRVEIFPTLLLTTRAKSTIASLQQQLTAAQTESTTGRHHDLGLALGGSISHAIAMRTDLERAEADATLFGQAGKRAEATQAGLTALDKLATQFLSALSGARGAENGATIAANQARSTFGSFHDVMNASFAGQYLFGGLNPAEPPLAGQDAVAAAVQTAFESAFGFPPDSPSAANITEADMEAFIDGAFAQLFEEPSWQANFSQAASENMKTGIGGSSVDASANANEAFARVMTKALSMMSSLGGNLNGGVFKFLTEKAISTVAEAQADLTSARTRIGTAQARLSEAADQVETRQAILTSAIRELEEVDQYEAATRVTTLMTQLEASYAITGRIGRLSLLNYL